MKGYAARVNFLGLGSSCYSLHNYMYCMQSHFHTSFKVDIHAIHYSLWRCLYLSGIFLLFPLWQLLYKAKVNTGFSICKLLQQVVCGIPKTARSFLPILKHLHGDFKNSRQTFSSAPAALRKIIIALYGCTVHEELVSFTPLPPPFSLSRISH